MNLDYVGNGKVYLIAGGGKVYTDIAARFCTSEKSVSEIIASDYDKRLVDTIVESGHLAATEFDYFIFGIEGYSRVTETQLVRKRHASYLIKSGRAEKKGKRNFDVVIPKSIENLSVEIPENETGILSTVINTNKDNKNIISVKTLLSLTEKLYNEGVNQGIPEEDLRYIKPQATEFKAIIGMNAHALMDWFKIRCCRKAQAEIRDLAYKMLRICRKTSPDLFKNAGPSCEVLGYCPENKMQSEDCSPYIVTKEDALKLLELLKDEQSQGRYKWHQFVEFKQKEYLNKTCEKTS